MKKLFTVLAVLLVASVAFAAFSGNVKAQYTFNFDERTIGYTKPGFSAVDVSFKWDSQTYTVGEADGTHIEVALNAGFDGFYNLSSDHAAGYDPFLKKSAWNWSYKWDSEEGRGTKVKAGVTLKVATFKIVGSNWEVNFIGDLGLDFAKSAIDSKTFNKYTLEENKQFYSMDNSVKGAHNLVATVAGYKFGFGIGTAFKDNDGNVVASDWTDAVRFALTAVTPEYDFNGVKAQFGAGYQISADDQENNTGKLDDYKTYAFAASAKVSYATDKIAVSGAYDAKVTENKANENFLYNDLAVKFDFAPVTVDVYFANEGAAVKDKFKDYFITSAHKDAEGNAIAVEKVLGSNYLSTQIVVDVARVAENVPVTVTLSGSDLLTEDEQVVDVEVETTIVPNFKFGVYFYDWFARTEDDSARKLGATVEFTGVQNLTLNGEVAYRFEHEDRDNLKKLFLLAGASYAHELFTASASIAAEKYYEQDMVLGAKASVVSTTLVKGAELSAKAYFNLNNLDGLDDSNNATNKLALACKVSF